MIKPRGRLWYDRGAMLEPSVVQQDEIIELLRERYAFRAIHEVTPLHGGSANCFRVDADDGRYVLKEFESKYSVKNIRIEPVLTTFLREHEFPSAEFVRTDDGLYAWSHRGRAFHLQRLVEGKVHAQNKAPQWLFDESARLLGQMHALLRDFPPLKLGFDPAWFNWTPKRKHDQYVVLREAAEKGLPKGEERERILADLEYKRSRLADVAVIRIDPRRLTLLSTHGDYHVSQILCDGEAVRAVIDFSSACKLPVTWEVLRSYSLADEHCADGSLDAQRLRAYFDRYIEGGGKVGRYDVATMALLYRLQLMRSVYGYKNYIRGMAEDRAAAQDELGAAYRRKLRHLLAFGFWRTDLCRWLEAHAEDLTNDLADLGR